MATNGDYSLNAEMEEFYTPAPPLAASRYNRQMLVPAISVSGQERIQSTKVLIVGLGGLGAPAALYLTGAGVGRIGFLDNDRVEISNLHRQIVHRESSVSNGLSKVQSAIQSCRELNSEPELVAHDMRLDISSPAKAEEVLTIFADYDLVLDCTDNPATRYLINDLCVIADKTLISGAAQRLEGQITVLNYKLPTGDRGPCYRCVFPTPPSPEMVKGCGEIGVVGPVVGTVGTLMASEALRIIAKGQEPRKPSMLMYNAWPTDPRTMFRSFGIRGRRPDCISCGEEEALRSSGKSKITRDDMVSERMDYISFCGLSTPISLLPLGQRISADALMDRMDSSKSMDAASSMDERTLVVDIRETEEIEMGAKLKKSTALPFSQLQRPKGIADLDDLLREQGHNEVLFVCQKGNDSQIAARKLEDYRKSKTSGMDTQQSVKELFIGDVKDGFVALEKWHAAHNISG